MQKPRMLWIFFCFSNIFSKILSILQYFVILKFGLVPWILNKTLIFTKSIVPTLIFPDFNCILIGSKKIDIYHENIDVFSTHRNIFLNYVRTKQWVLTVCAIFRRTDLQVKINMLYLGCDMCLALAGFSYSWDRYIRN